MIWTASKDSITTTAATVPLKTLRGEDCYGCDVTITTAAGSAVYRSPDTFLLEADWTILVGQYLERALAGATGGDIWEDPFIVG